MKSFRDDLIDRMKTGQGRFVLASREEDSLSMSKDLGRELSSPIAHD
jgi:hypothetical protein